MASAQLVENFLQALTAGLSVGAIYGLMCVGLALIFGVMRVINFAQGDFMMLGMYVAYYIFIALGVQVAFGSTFGPYIAIILAGPVLFIVGYGVHQLLISRVTGRRTAALEGEGHYAQLVLTLGISLVLQNGGQIVFGSILQSIRTPLSRSAWEIGSLSGDLVSVFVNKARVRGKRDHIVCSKLLQVGIIADSPVPGGAHDPNSSRASRDSQRITSRASWWRVAKPSSPSSRSPN